MKALSLVMAMVGLMAAPMSGYAAEESDSAYLFTFFNDATHSLFMAVSHDGYTFTAVNDGKPVISGDTIAAQRGIRDPHIYRGPDGKFYMALTDLHIYGQENGLRDTKWERDDKYGWGNNRGIVLMKSDDLIKWTHNEVFVDSLFPERFGDLCCAWAPETIWDPVEGKMMIYFTIRETPYHHIDLYYAYADPEFTTLVTEPKPLIEYPLKESPLLDADICPMPDGRYFMTFVAQEMPAGIKYMISDKINHFSDYHPDQIDSERGGCEAPNTWKRLGEDKWVIMYDIYSARPHNFGFIETTDFEHFTPLGRFNEGVMKATNFESPKHGSVIHITAEEAARLEALKR